MRRTSHTEQNVPRYALQNNVTPERMRTMRTRNSIEYVRVARAVRTMSGQRPDTVRNTLLSALSAHRQSFESRHCREQLLLRPVVLLIVPFSVMFGP